MAGIGGKVGLKGSDGTQTLKKALELGAVPEAGTKALGTMKLLKPMEQQLEIHTCPGNMGEDICKQAGLNYRLAGDQSLEPVLPLFPKHYSERHHGRCRDALQ